MPMARRFVLLVALVAAPACGGISSDVDADGSGTDGTDVRPREDGGDAAETDGRREDVGSGGDDDATTSDDGGLPGSCGDGTVQAGEECDDGDATPGDGCEPDCRYSCHSNTECGDPNPCTIDVCSPPGAGRLCTHDPNEGVSCEDGNLCTAGDTCNGEAECTPGANVCECSTDDDCLPHEDGDACNGKLECSSDECVLNPLSVVVCDRSADTPCRHNMCEPATGECSMRNLTPGHGCDDSDACTTGDHCDADGRCVGDVRSCGDDNPCTDDVCDTSRGCVHVNNSAWCDDHDACTTDDVCAGGVCSGRGLPACLDDGDPCTSDVCDPMTGNCGVPLCHDGNPCTSDNCNPAELSCSYPAVPDGTLCPDSTGTGTGACADGVCVSAT